jgi:regulator of protease activity HflC (stomatin/prohibitin superfamily)
MPIRFIIGLSLVGLTIIAFILFRAYTKKNKNPEERTDYSEDAAVAKVTTWVLGIAAVLLIASSCITVVGTRRIGVVTDFGRPVDSLSNGIHFKLPWQRVSELDGSIQTDSYIGSSDGDEQPCTDIRIGNESTACVDNTVRWRIVTAEADQLYRDFRNMDNIRESLVTRELNASLNQVLGDYNPLDAVNLDESGALANLDELADAVAESLRERVEGRVEVLSVTIPLINYDNGTQDRLNRYQQQVADTRIAEEAEQTALAQARANEALSESVSNDPNVLVAQCFDLLGDMVDADQPIPAGFSCWPGGSSAVVLPAVPNTPQ